MNRVKTLWNKRRRKDQAEAEERRKAEERHRAEEQRLAGERRIEEERRRTEDLRDSVVNRIEARQLQAEKQREEARRRIEEIVEEETLRQVAERQRIEEQRQAELAAQHNEQVRRGLVFFNHRQAVANEVKRLQAGQCTWADYYAFILQDRIERSAELLFGNVQQPSYELLQKSPELLVKLKDNLSFGNDQHPGNYHDPYVSAYYSLRYELGYAFEYSQIYGILLDIMRQNNEAPLLDVLSIGSGQGLDYWGLCYALSQRGAPWPRIGWRGIDLETWPDHILDDGVAQYSDGTNVCDILGGIHTLDAKVLMFPKVISELSNEVVMSIASWLEHVTFTRDVHYLCFAHTERKSLDPSDRGHRGAKDYFHGVTESSLDAVKSAAIIRAACIGANRQSYKPILDWSDGKTISVSYYDVVWENRRPEDPTHYPYLIYSDVKSRVWNYDTTFEFDQCLIDAIKNIGSRCCPTLLQIPADAFSRGNIDCDTYPVGCDNPRSCPLHKNPRFKTGGIAYQIVPLVKQPNYDEGYDEDIPF